MDYALRRDDVDPITITTVEGQALSAPASIRVLAESATSILIEVTMNGFSPPHTHDHDSVGYVVSGGVRMKIDGEQFELGPVDGFHHPKGVEHEMSPIDESAVWLEIKSPPARTW